MEQQHIGGGSDKSLVSIHKLLEDLARMLDNHESADVIFVVGLEEVLVYAHKALLQVRCKSFQSMNNQELNRPPGFVVISTSAGSPTRIRLPHYTPDVFRLVTAYIYTGRICFGDDSIFEVMQIAQDFGCEELRQTCEDHVASTLSVDSACAFLNAAVYASDSSPGSKTSRVFAERCVTFIGEKAEECMKTPSFLNMSKEALIRLLSSDQLQVEEEEVWRGVLAWAKHKAGVAKPTTFWTEEERTRVCHHLSGVINHVRLLLIDSQVFAEEVEPTGAVPIETSLERYRFAALPNKFRESEDKRMRPRISLRLFQDTQILNQDKVHLQRILNQWYGEQKQAWRLLFRASLHGYSAEAFHRHCDGFAPTFVIVLGTNGSVCGGFSDVAWGESSDRKGKYVATEKAFLFTLINHHDTPPTRFEIKKKTFAVVQHPDFGPIFGGGADLCIASNCNRCMDSYSNLPHSYDGDAASSTILMGNYSFSVEDYEVFVPSR